MQYYFWDTCLLHCFMLQNLFCRRQPLSKAKWIFWSPQNHTYFLNFIQGEKSSRKTSKWKDSCICRLDAYLIHISLCRSCSDCRLAFTQSHKDVIEKLLSQLLISKRSPSFSDKVNAFCSTAEKDFSYYRVHQKPSNCSLICMCTIVLMR